MRVRRGGEEVGGQEGRGKGTLPATQAPEKGVQVTDNT